MAVRIQNLRCSPENLLQKLKSEILYASIVVDLQGEVAARKPFQCWNSAGKGFTMAQRVFQWNKRIVSNSLNQYLVMLRL